MSHLFLAQNFLPQCFLSIETVCWSLAIEFQLYLLFPLLLMMAQKIGWLQAILVTGFVELISRTALIATGYILDLHYTAEGWAWVYASPFSFWFSWSLGALLAQAHVERRPLPFRDGPLPLWLWPLAVWLFHNVPGLAYFDFPLAAFATTRYLSYFLSERTQGIMTGVTGHLSSCILRILSFLGLISYSLYLIHLPIYNFMNEFIPRAHGSLAVRLFHFVYVGLELIVITAASCVLYLALEKPGISLGKSIIRLVCGYTDAASKRSAAAGPRIRP